MPSIPYPPPPSPPTATQVKSLITLVCDTSQHTQSKTTAKMCLWFLSMQDFTAAQLKKVHTHTLNPQP
jgi:hypothetical protein